MTIGDVNAAEFAIVKFVVVDGEYRFLEQIVTEGVHSELVGDHEVATAAGTLFVMPDHWKMHAWDSTTLGVRCGLGEVEALREMIDRPYEDERG
jgi:hypothetical protein